MPNKHTSYWVLVFVIYFMVHALIRMSMGWSLSSDEVQILRDSQHFAWIYNGEMPLYVWMQSAVFDVLGMNILGLSLVKNAILLMICISVFTMVERVSDRKWALAATISLLFVPQLVWTSQHEMTAPVLATMFAATTMLSYSKLIERQGGANYLILGTMIGLGAISSVSYLIVPASLILASLSMRHFRPILFNKFMVLTAAIAVGIAFRPYAELWPELDFSWLTADSMYPMSFDVLILRTLGMYGALQTSLTFASLLILGVAITVYGGLGRDIEVSEPMVLLRDCLVRVFSFGLLIIFSIAFLRGSATLNHATMQPILFFSAPIAALFLYPVMSTKSHRKTATVAAVIAAAILLATPAHYSFSDRVAVTIEPNRIENISPTASLN